jgi:phage shock protein A
MSNEESLKQENNSLKQQLENAVNTANNFVSQLDAHKGALSEQIQQNLNLRTQVIILSQKIKQYDDQVKAYKEKENAADKKLIE